MYRISCKVTEHYSYTCMRHLLEKSSQHPQVKHQLLCLCSLEQKKTKKQQKQNHAKNILSYYFSLLMILATYIEFVYIYATLCTYPIITSWFQTGSNCSLMIWSNDLLMLFSTVTSSVSNCSENMKHCSNCSPLLKLTQKHGASIARRKVLPVSSRPQFFPYIEYVAIFTNLASVQGNYRCT